MLIIELVGAMEEMFRKEEKAQQWIVCIFVLFEGGGLEAGQSDGRRRADEARLGVKIRDTAKYMVNL